MLWHLQFSTFKVMLDTLQSLKLMTDQLEEAHKKNLMDRCVMHTEASEELFVMENSLLLKS